MQFWAVVQVGGSGQLALHDERNGSFILIGKILSSFVKPGSGPALSAIPGCIAGGQAVALHDE